MSSRKVVIHIDDQLNTTFSRIYFSGQSKKLNGDVTKINRKYAHREFSWNIISQLNTAEVTVLRTPKDIGTSKERFMVFTGNPQVVGGVVNENLVNKIKLVDAFIDALANRYRYLGESRIVDLIKYNMEKRKLDTNLLPPPVLGLMIISNFDILTDGELKLLLERYVILSVHKE